MHGGLTVLNWQRRMLGIVFCFVAAPLVAGIAPLDASRKATAAPGQADVVIVGDSLTGGNANFIGTTLRNAGLNVRVEGLSARRIAVSFDFLGRRDSGVERVRSLKGAGVSPALWVIQLGTNDLGVINNCGCPDPVAFAGTIIDQLLDEIGSGIPIAWVTVANRSQWDASRWFNSAITIRAARDPHIALIRWNELSASRPDWFVDHVHQNSAGVRVFTQMYIDRISALLTNPLGPRPPGPGLAAATRLGPS
jgi:lysophospholipase L1-like esterase